MIAVFPYKAQAVTDLKVVKPQPKSSEEKLLTHPYNTENHSLQ